MADEPTPASPSSETPPPRTTGGNWRWEPPTAEELQKLMPGYTIEKILGRGGMGAVYRGVQTNLDRPVAIKILPPGVEKEDPSFAERFKSEARLMARLSHPAVVAVYDFGTNAGGQLYFAMEYVDGSDVSQMIAAQGKLPPEHALAITAHVCDALQAAHELGIVHRDIKPANVLLNMKGQVKVADFGLAKVEDPGQHGLTKTGYAMGTPDFVAPEALMLGTAIDGRADLYAVGVMLYQMLTGNIPRGAFKPASVLVPGLDPRFDPIILKAMQHDREERHQNAAELRRELDVILTVPFVRNDAPVSAAIPVAQVAQAPGQRSAAQKPQPQRSAGAPTRQPSVKAGEGTRAPETSPKSTTPLFIGIAAAAAIGIGAFVMLGGGKKEAKPSASLAPSSGTSVVTAPKPAPEPPKPAPASPSPAVSKSATPTISKPSEKFPPGRWVKVFTKADELPEDLRKPDSDVKFEDGWLSSSKPVGLRVQPNPGWRNGAIRYRTQVSDNLLSLPMIRVQRMGVNASKAYQFRISTRAFLMQYFDTKLGAGDARGQTLIEYPSKLPSMPNGSEQLIEFGMVSKRMIGRVGASFLTHDGDSRLASGETSVFLQAPIRDIEVINLDGLSEAEALKILGVDEKGNDLRKPDTVAATAPASSVSYSPSPPVSKSSDPKFPPGQWVKVFTKFEDLPEELRKADSGTQMDDGWLKSVKRLNLPSLGLPAVTNLGLRVTLKGADKDAAAFLATIGLRYDDADTSSLLMLRQYAHSIQLARIGLVTRKHPVRPSDHILHTESIFSPVDRPWAIEFAVVGKRLIGRVDGKLMPLVESGEPAHGRMPGFVSTANSMHDIEVINLDGLPEAEALRILGVDEKGNDLRALVAKQELQMAEQTKVVDALAAIPELKALHEQFVKLKAERVTAPFEAEVAKLNAGYVGGIDREIANEKKAGHLDGVLALEEEKKTVAGARTPSSAAVPMTEDAGEGTRAPALKKLRGIYREAYAKIEAARAENLKALTDPLDARLKQIEATLTQQDRIEHAKTVREYREGLGKEGGAGIPSGAAQPVRPASTDGAAATMNEADKSVRAPLKKFPPGDDRKAAEWVLNSGGLVKIEDGRGLQTITSVEALPKKSFELHEINFKGKNGQPAPEITDLTPLAGLQALRRVMLTGAQINDTDTDLLASCPLLQHMDLAYTTKFTGATAAKLAESGSLQEFVAGGSALTGEGLKQLSEVSSLMRLNFSKCKITDADMASLSRLKKLISVRLHLTGVTLEGWRQIKDLPLTEIGFHSEPGKMASDCQELATLFPKTQLVEFVSNSPFAAEDAAALAKFESLNKLVITSSHLDDAILETLVGLQDVIELQLKSQDAPITQISDEGIAQLLELKLLNHLQLEKCDSITPAVLSTLTKHKALRKLTLRSCPQVTEAAIAAFKKARPDVTVAR
jgi:serine/threonine protein kinase